jgi:hypothetical protein
MKGQSVASATSTETSQALYLNGNIDGGDMDACTEAMEYLDPPLDGGLL